MRSHSEDNWDKTFDCKFSLPSRRPRPTKIALVLLGVFVSSASILVLQMPPVPPVPPMVPVVPVPAPAVVWTYVPDGLDEPLPEPIVNPQTKLDFPHEISNQGFPATHGSYSLLRSRNDQVQVIDLAKMEAIGPVFSVSATAGGGSLSSDGKLTAFFLGQEVQVFDSVAGKRIQSVPLVHQGWNFHLPVFFARADKLVVHGWIVKLGKAPSVSFLNVPALPNGQCWAVSPKGRDWVLLTGDKKISVLNLDTGGLTGQLEVPLRDLFVECLGMGFSKDGRQLACCVAEARKGNAFPSFSVFVWDMVKGLLSSSFELTHLPMAPRGQPNLQWNLQWLPDGRGFVVGGAALIDVRSKTLVWKKGFPADPWRCGPFRAIGPKHLAALKQSPFSTERELVTIPDIDPGRAP